MRFPSAASITESGVAREIGTTVLTNGYSAGAAFAGGAVLAHWLGPQLRGRFELAMFFANASLLILGLGLNVPATVFATTRPGRGFWAFRMGVAITVTALIVAGTGAVLGIPVVFRVDSTFTLGIVAAFGGLQLMQLTNAILIGIGRIHSQNIALAARWTAYLVLLGVLSVTATRDASLALGAYALSLFVGAAWGWARVGTDVRRDVRVKSDPSGRREALSFALRSQFANVFQFASYRFDVLLVGAWAGAPALGVYAVGVMFSEALWLLPNAVGTVLLSHTSRSSNEESDRRIGWVFTLACGLVLVGAAFLQLLAWVVTRYYLGPQYAQVPLVTGLLMPGAIALSGTKILSNELVARGFPGVNTIVALGGAAITITGDLLLIPSRGIIGASFASTVGYSAAFVMSILAFRQRAKGRLLVLRNVSRVPDKAQA